MLHKAFKAVSAAITENRIRVVASTTGNLDRSGDVIMPGAFKNAVLRDFEQNGWIDVGHSWDGLGCAMPISAKVDGDELISEAEFYADEDAQCVKERCKQRMDAGKSVSASIGFMPDYATCKWFQTGKELLAWAEESGYNLASLDVAGLKAWKDYCRAIVTVKELFEWSIVAVGMNPRAKAIAVKTFSDEQGAGTSLVEHFELVLATAEDLATRLESIQRTRQSESGRSLSPAHKANIDALHKRFGELSGFISDPTPDPDSSAAEERVADLQARIAGAFAGVF